MNKSSNKGCFSGILGTLAVILGVVVYAFISSLLNRLFIEARFGEETAGAILSLSLTGITVAFVLYEVIFIMWQIKLSQEVSMKDDGGRLKKIFIIVLVSCITLSLGFAVVGANTYTELRDDSIAKVCFTTQKEYRWGERNDVLRYSFTCDEDGALTFRVTMKDGKSFDLLGGVNVLSDSFREKYNVDKVDLLKYVAGLSEQFDKSEYIIERVVSDATVENAKKVYENDESKALIWEQIHIIIE